MGDTAEPDGTGGAAAASNGGALTGAQGLVQALHGLIDVQRSTGFTKHLKPPSVFAPENRGDELNKWMDWRFQFETFIGAVDPSMLSHMKHAEKEENPINDGLPSVRPHETETPSTCERCDQPEWSRGLASDHQGPSTEDKAALTCTHPVPEQDPV